MLLIMPYKSTGDDRELRVTLRSWEQNFKGKVELLIVGDRPKTLLESSYHHLEGNILGPQGKFANVALNVLAGATWALENGHKESIVLNDDFVLLKPVSARDFKLFRRNDTVASFNATLRQWNDWRTLWGKTNQETARILEAKETYLSHATFSYEVHAPQLIDNALMIEALSEINWKADIYPQWRTIYGAKVEELVKFGEKLLKKYSTIEAIDDPKVRADGSRRANTYFLSFSEKDRGNVALIQVEKEFTKPSRWELKIFSKRVAVAISTTGTRPTYLAQTINGFMSFLPDELTINFDLNRSGVATTKNKGIKWFLEETDADYLVLADDDVWPVKDWKFNYIAIMEKYSIPHLSPVLVGSRIVEETADLTYGRHPNGTILIYTREALEKVGYMRAKDFGKFGWEHVEHSKRIANCYPEIYRAEAPFIDVLNSGQFWRGADFTNHGGIKPMAQRYQFSTFGKNEREFDKAEEIYRSFIDSTDYVDY